MKHSRVLVFLALCGSALSAPKSENELISRTSNQCNSVTAIISILSQHRASATSFCSSFISVPVKTVTSANVPLIFLLKPSAESLILAGRNIDVEHFDGDTGKDGNSKSVCNTWFN